MVNVAVFASGSGSNFQKIVEHNMQYAQIKLLLVDKDGIYAIERANQLGIPYVFVNPKAFKNKAAFENKIKQYLEEYNIEIIALAGYMRIIGQVLLESYSNKIINIHPAYLPSFPGAHGIQDAFDAKVKETGVTIHYVDSGIDTGSIITQEKIQIDPQWDLETLEQHVHALEYKMYPSALDTLCKEIENEKSIN